MKQCMIHLGLSDLSIIATVSHHCPQFSMHAVNHFVLCFENTSRASSIAKKGV